MSYRCRCFNSQWHHSSNTVSGRLLESSLRSYHEGLDTLFTDGVLHELLWIITLGKFVKDAHLAL
jgi:hypothetical protein